MIFLKKWVDCSLISFDVIWIPLGQGQRFTGEIMQVLQFGEFSMTANFSKVGGESHEENNKALNDYETRYSCQGEHECSRFDALFAEFENIFLALYEHVCLFGV